MQNCDIYKIQHFVEKNTIQINDLSYEKMREILKHLKLQEYTKNINYIMKNVFKKKILMIDHEVK